MNFPYNSSNLRPDLTYNAETLLEASVLCHGRTRINPNNGKLEVYIPDYNLYRQSDVRNIDTSVYYDEILNETASDVINSK